MKCRRLDWTQVPEVRIGGCWLGRSVPIRISWFPSTPRRAEVEVNAPVQASVAGACVPAVASKE
eukprot:scaffold8053_cov55-Phaeocystis_antarctica.AAC.3